MMKINTDELAIKLQELPGYDELCKQERYDVLAKAAGFESFLFAECVKKNADKKERRAKKRRDREKARRRKLRRRQRKKEKKKSLRSTEKSKDIDIRDSDIVNAPDQLVRLKNELQKRGKDNKENNYNKVRHESEKSASRRRRKSLSIFLVGSTVTNPTTKQIDTLT